MRADKALSMCQPTSKKPFGVLGWVVLGAAVGAMAAGIYGVLYGTLDGLLHGDFSRVASAGLYCALCGAVAGALVGGFVRMIDSEGVADLTGRSPQSAGHRGAVLLMPCALANPLIARWRSSSEGGPRINEPSLN
jgi:hypothetical protein